MSKITPMLWFDTQAHEAAQLYVSLFPNSRITDVSHYPEGTPYPAGAVMTVAFELDGAPFTALNGGPQFQFTEAISYVISCADQDEVDHYWNGLVEGGEESQCGWLKDRFGLSWQVTPSRLIELMTDPDPARAGAAAQAMMTMQKIDIAALEAAVAAVDS